MTIQLGLSFCNHTLAGYLAFRIERAALQVPLTWSVQVFSSSTGKPVAWHQGQFEPVFNALYFVQGVSCLCVLCCSVGPSPNSRGAALAGNRTPNSLISIPTHPDRRHHPHSTVCMRKTTRFNIDFTFCTKKRFRVDVLMLVQGKSRPRG